MESIFTELTIKSPKYGPVSFRLSPATGNVYLLSGPKPGQHGRQLCKRGSFSGEALTATPENFERVCKRWHKLHIEAIADLGTRYYE